MRVLLDTHIFLGGRIADVRSACRPVFGDQSADVGEVGVGGEQDEAAGAGDGGLYVNVAE